MLNTIFKAYDVRGTVPDQLNPDLCYQIGKAFVTLVQTPEIIVARDMRDSGKELSEAFIKGATELGCNVIVIGQVCTDASYFAAGHLNKPAVMFTASHNPAGYNGMKFSKAGAVPINQDTGLQQMKECIETESYKSVSETPGRVSEQEVLPEYVDHVHSFVTKEKLNKLKIAIDAGNGMGGKIAPLVFDSLPIDVVSLFFELDGSFPNHPADPSKSENMTWLQEAVKKESCDFGMGFDGDADRVFFVDERGEIVNSSLITSLIAKNMLEKSPSSTIIHNLVCSHIVPDTIKKYGGTPVVERVGHSFIKQTMAKTNAVFAGEHSAHYYYRDNYNADSGFITAVILCEVVSQSGKKLSELLDEFRVYATLEETSVKVSDKDTVIAHIKEKYTAQNPLTFSDMDGITFEFENWWFNVRPSNTEPLLRLNLEAHSQELMVEKKEEVLSLFK